LQWFALVFLLLATAGLLGAGVYFAINPDAAGDDGIVGAIFMFFFAAIMAPFAYMLLRKLRPRRATHLSVSVDRPAPRRGEEVVVRLDVLDPGKIAGQVDVALRCIAHYEATAYVNGNRTAQTREHTAFEDRRELNGSGSQEFRFTLPADGPFSYEGTYLSTVWKVVARDAQPRRTDRVLEQELEVKP
jgi:hypothetical protein